MSAKDIAKMMAIIVNVFESAGLTMSEKKTKTMLLRAPGSGTPNLPLVIEAAGQRYRQATQFIYLGRFVNAIADIFPDIKRRVRLAWGCCKRSCTI